MRLLTLTSIISKKGTLHLLDEWCQTKTTHSLSHLQPQQAFTTMDFNTTCIPGNNSSACSPPTSSKTGLIVGLSVFFVLLLLIIVAGIFAYKQFGRLRRAMSFGSRKRSPEIEEKECGEAPRRVRENHEYATRPEVASQAPIYENVTRKTPGYSPKTQMSPRCEPEDDVYLQCDAIYGNDPVCNPSVEQPEDDTYIIPDS